MKEEKIIWITKFFIKTNFIIIMLISLLFANKLPLEDILNEYGENIKDIMSLAQDSTGFIWIGTKNGLYRYDNYEIKKFPFFKKDFNKYDSIFTDISKIYIDSKSHLWAVASRNILIKINLKDFFINIYSFPKLDSFKITSLISFPNDTSFILIGTDIKGLIKLNIINGKYKRFEKNTLLYLSSITDLYLDNFKNLLIITKSSGIIKFNFNNNKFSYFKILNFTPFEAKKIFQDKNNYYWLVVFNGVYKINKYKKSIEFFNLKKTKNTPIFFPINVVSLKNNLTFFSDGFGLYKYVPQKKRFEYFEIFNFPIINSILIDKSKNVWLGTIYGLKKINYVYFNLKFMDLKKYFKKNIYNFNCISSIWPDTNNNIWLGTFWNGVIKFNLNTKKVKIFENNQNGKKILPSNSIKSIARLNSHEILINTSKGIIIYNQKSKKLYQNFFELIKNKKDNEKIKQMLVEKDKKRIWLCSKHYLYKFSKKNKKFLEYFYSKKINFTKFIYIQQTISGNLWLATFDKIYFLNKRENNIMNIKLKKTIPSLYITNLLLDNNDNLWISTNYNGIFLAHKSDQRIILQNILKNGLNIFQFKNYLWIFTKNSFIKYNLNTKIKFELKLTKILENKEILPYGVYNKDFGFIVPICKSLLIIDPNKFIELNEKVNIEITDIKFFNKSIYDDSIYKSNILYKKFIKLPFNKNFISFKFVGLNSNDPLKLKYKYKLEGFENNWHITKANNRIATYTNLPPGKYTFNVKGNNSNGNWSNGITKIRIIITPPFWKTWWAYLIYFFAFIGILYIYIKYKTYSQRQELKRKEAELKKEQEISERLRNIDRLKDEFLAKTSHELRTPLNGIIGIAESLIDGVTGPLTDIAKANLAMIVASGRRLASLINDILDFSKLKNRELSLNKKVVDMRILTDFVLALNKTLAEKKGLYLKNEIKGDKYKVYGDENRLQQIMINLVGNAIKFTEEGGVSVFAIDGDNYIKISIKDTGPGIPKDKFNIIFKSFEQLDGSDTRDYGGTGLGLSITKDLIHLHGGEIYLESKMGKGSIFSFTVPKGKGNAKNRNMMKELSKVSLVISKAAKDAIEEKKDENYEFSILIVDDDEINIQVLENQLTLANYKVSKAFNGKEALKKIEKGEKFDLILLDIMMPGISGLEVAQKIREKYLPNELPIIMVTAKDQVSDLQNSLEVGANDYIAKPFSKEEMLSRIKTHLNLLKINSSYARFVPKEFLETLGKESIIEVKLGDQIQDEMTILFSDIRSFTSISEKMTPKENINFLNDYLKSVIPCIRKYSGFIDKYIGDAFMAIFPDSPENAVKASIDVMKSLQEYNYKRKKENKFVVNIGIGIHTGISMLGTIGDEERIDGTVISDAVNFASRLEGLTKIYGASILLSEITFSRIEDLNNYNYRFLGKVQVKGKKKFNKIYEFFDGDNDNLKELKKRTKIDFVNALNAYFNREFAAAIVLFKKVLSLNPKDKAAELYLKNSAEYVVSGVPEDWDGVQIFTVK